MDLCILKPCVREWISSETKASSGWEERNRAKTCGRRGVCGACEVMGGGSGTLPWVRAGDRPHSQSRCATCGHREPRKHCPLLLNCMHLVLLA